MKYTEGIAFDGTAILQDGLPLTISEILKLLNDREILENQLRVQKALNAKYRLKLGLTDEVTDFTNPLT